MALRVLPVLLSLLSSNFLPNRASALRFDQASISNPTHNFEPFCSVLANLLELSDCQEQLRLLKGIPLLVVNLTAPTGAMPLSPSSPNTTTYHTTTYSPPPSGMSRLAKRRCSRAQQIRNQRSTYRSSRPILLSTSTYYCFDPLIFSQNAELCLFWSAC
jgi:hypothetical protein